MSEISSEAFIGQNEHVNGTGSKKEGKSPNASLIVGEQFSFEAIQEIADYLRQKTKFRPKIGIICGSGLGHLANHLQESDAFPYEDIPNFPVSTVPGHAGKMVFGSLNGVEVMCMQGRFHHYEGYSLATCSMPVRVMKLIGCTHLIATNAVGGLNENYKVGDIMIVKDHVNIMGFVGNSPLSGPNESRFGTRFLPMNKAYDAELIKSAQKIAKDIGMENVVHTGCLTCLGGPNYETVAELRLWKILGVDSIGMSVIHEAITARHCGMKVFAFSLITNRCITEYDTDEEANHEEVIEVGLQRQGALAKFVMEIVKKIDETE